MAEVLVWQKSSFSQDENGANCLEIAAPEANRPLLRESDEPGKVITTTPAGLAALIRNLRHGPVR
ncbi:DUF397 domain-containing protein [Streptomyces capitiformicae]|nr:DUF397 domain-containing protein [Streptomyces capitiformicae]